MRIEHAGRFDDVTILGRFVRSPDLGRIESPDRIKGSAPHSAHAQSNRCRSNIFARESEHGTFPPPGIRHDGATRFFRGRGSFPQTGIWYDSRSLVA